MLWVSAWYSYKWEAIYILMMVLCHTIDSSYVPYTYYIYGHTTQHADCPVANATRRGYGFPAEKLN